MQPTNVNSPDSNYQSPNQAPALTPAEDPGKTLGIVGFVFAFVGLQIVGLILSIIGYKKSKRAGYKNTLAFAGILLNAIIVVLSLLIIPILISITIVSYSGISARANTSSAQASAASVVKQSERIGLDTGAYPTTIAEIADETPGVTYSTREFIVKPTNPTTVLLFTCGPEGNKVGYWNYTDARTVYIYSGEASALSSCVLATS